jgi:predicted Zn-dependent peptidase
MDRRKLKDFFFRHYLQIPPIIVAAGRLKHEDLLRPVQKALRKIKSRPKEKKIRPPRPHPQIQIKNKQLEQVHLLLGTQGLAAVNPRRYVFTILNTILGGGMSSRLFQEVREKRGLAYSVYSFVSSFVDSGLLGVYAGTGIHNLRRVLQVILREMTRLAENSIRPKELRSAKDQLKGNLLLSLESTESRMSRLAKNEIFFHRYISTEEIIEGIEKVSAEEICSLAQGVFRPDSLSLTVLGPITEKDIPPTLLTS